MSSTAHHALECVITGRQGYYCTEVRVEGIEPLKIHPSEAVKATMQNTDAGDEDSRAGKGASGAGSEQCQSM